MKHPSERGSPNEPLSLERAQHIVRFTGHARLQDLDLIFVSCGCDCGCDCGFDAFLTACQIRQAVIPINYLPGALPQTIPSNPGIVPDRLDGDNTMSTAARDFLEMVKG